MTQMSYAVAVFSIARLPSAMMTFPSKEVTIQIPFAGDRSLRVHGGKQSFLVRRYELSSDRRNIKHLPRFVINGRLDEKGTATFLTFANRVNNGVVGVMHRFEPMAFVAFLSTGLALFAFSLFSAFVRTVGLGPFQTI